MKKLKTIKVSEETITNINLAAAYTKKRQWQISEQASEDILKKITDKIKADKEIKK